MATNPRPPTSAQTTSPSRHSTTNDERTRLHISPFDQALLPALIPSSLLPWATNISYHSLQTFPDANYGFVDLPRMEADKLKRKMHGSILKGRKLRVEEARPEKRAHKSHDSNEQDERSARSEKRAKRRKREEGVLPAVEIPEGRQIERGWTKPAASRSKASGKVSDSKGSYSTRRECQFRTTLPPNVASSTSPPLIADTKAKMGQRRVKDQSGRETVIHEFSSTTKYSTFLRSNDAVKGGRVVSEFIDGKGWVDESGDLVEAAKPAPSQKKTRSSQLQGSSHPDITVSAQSSSTDLSTTSNKNDSDPTKDDESDVSEDEISSITSSSDDLSASPEPPQPSRRRPHTRAQPVIDTLQVPPTAKPETKTSPTSAGSVPSLSITIPTNDSSPTTAHPPEPHDHSPTHSTHPTAPATTAPTPHPLETLFKRPTLKPIPPALKTSVEIDKSFTFFDHDRDADEAERVLADTPVPHTPFTRRDFEMRGQRSAAPTPDTAAPGKAFAFPWRRGDEDGDDDDDDDDDDAGRYKVQYPGENDDGNGEGDALTTPSSRGAEAKKGFEEAFWEKRGETNRAWKRRRRETGKEKRRRENKRLEGKAF
ncbi:MAG: hypothetical protein M1833_003920 [Piccolia ochrophora]|nr:MAG: hypothetical protein M1833_003920 [Piccolia ochrophora]